MLLSDWQNIDMTEAVIANGAPSDGLHGVWWKGATQDEVFLTVRRVRGRRLTYVANDGTGAEVATISRAGRRRSSRWTVALPDGRTFNAGAPELGMHPRGTWFTHTRLDSDTTDEGFWLRRTHSTLTGNPITLIMVAEPHAGRPWDSVTPEQALASVLVLNAYDYVTDAS